MSSTHIPDDDLRALIALFYKYNIEMTQLQIFINEENKVWLDAGERAYWVKRIFAP